PALHRFWLDHLGIEGDYRPVRVRPEELGAYLNNRRGDPDWLGCNATIPHKESIAALVDDVASDAATVGAVNCVLPDGDRLLGQNTDVEGIAAAIGHVPVEDRPVALIGAGGAARAMLAYLQRRSVAEVTILARDQTKVAILRDCWPGLRLTFRPIEEPRIASDTALIVNASPLGMAGSAPMPRSLLEAVANSGSTLFDMVYQPLQTDFLRAGKGAGAETIDGLTMLIGQARRAFSLFFGTEAPSGDAAVRAVLTGDTLPSVRNA
ncbi:MAG: shikimate dehydrogenase, partial [Sphingomicrobium sp.]